MKIRIFFVAIAACVLTAPAAALATIATAEPAAAADANIWQ